MRLQLALDRLTKEKCIQIVDETFDFIDVIEIGTGVIKEYGMSIVREMHQLYPDKTLLADMKTCDAGAHEAKQAFEAGADIITVMAFSSDATITDTLKVAKEFDKQVMVDLLEIHSKDRIAQLQDLGVDLVSLHVGKDKQQGGGTFNTDLFSLVKGFHFDVTVAGGINLETLPTIIKEKPHTIIVGSAVTKAQNPKQVAQQMKQIIG